MNAASYKNGRMGTPDLPENPVRANLVQVIEDMPGSSIQELSNALGLSRGATRHHLNHLDKEGFITVYRQGNHRLHFASRMPPMRRKAISLLRISSIRSIVDETIESPRFRAADLTAATELSARSVRRGVKILARAGLAESRTVKWGVYDIRYHPELRIAWVLYSKDAGRAAPAPLRETPGWILGLEILLGKLSIGAWSS